MNRILEIINPNNTISLNRQLAHALGLSEAVVFGALLAKYAYYEKNGTLTEDGWFFSTADDLMESTALTVKQQRRCIDKLTAAGLIRCELRGIPAKRYFRITDDISLLESLLSIGKKASVSDAPAAEAQTTAAAHPEGKASFAEKDKQDVPKGQNKICPNGETSSTQTANKTRDNKTRENKPEEVKPDSTRAQINYPALCERYGEGFAKLAAQTVAEGLCGAFTLTTDGRTIPASEIIPAYQRVNYETVCHVADYIAGKNDIRNLPAYLRRALFTASGESCCKPLKPPALPTETSSSINMEEILADLAAQYTGDSSSLW